MFSKLGLLSVLSLAIFTTGCIVGDVDDLEVCTPAQRIDLVTNLLTNEYEGTGGFDISADITDLNGSGATVTKVAVRSITLTAVSGITNFDFAESATASITADNDPSAAPVVLFDYQNASHASAPSPLAIESETDINLNALLASGPVTAHFLVKGNPPTLEWSIDAVACFTISMRIKAGL